MTSSRNHSLIGGAQTVLHPICAPTEIKVRTHSKTLKFRVRTHQFQPMKSRCADAQHPVFRIFAVQVRTRFSLPFAHSSLSTNEIKVRKCASPIFCAVGVLVTRTVRNPYTPPSPLRGGGGVE